MIEPTLVLFPPLGGDRRAYGPQQSIPLRLEFIDWIEPESQHESFPHYAERMASRITPREKLYIGGVSLGAMAALEAASHVDASGLISIGGCTSSRQIAPLFRGVLKIGAMATQRIARWSVAAAPLALKLFEKLDRPNRQLITTMMREHSMRQTQWSCRALLEWECCKDPPTLPIHSIHGALDRVIPPANINPEKLIAGGRHMINLTHPAEVNRFVLEAIKGAVRLSRSTA
jgi:pimeloyl-ACP methyl ester carboxylesterase